MKRLLVVATLAFAVQLTRAQQPGAGFLIGAVCQAELQADRDDHTPLQYRDHDVTPEHDTLVYTVETPHGDLSRKLEDHGHPLDRQQQAAESARLRQVVAHPAALQKKMEDEAHDDHQAAQMLALLPHAFLWSVAGEQGELVTLDFRPDPHYDPHSMEDRVFAAMAGQVVVDRRERRIYSMRGILTADVKFGYGILGRLRKGGTFEVQRRQVAPGHWQMTASHVHLVGKALFFKTIGSDEDEQRDEFRLSPARSLQQAYDLLPNP